MTPTRAIALLLPLLTAAGAAAAAQPRDWTGAQIMQAVHARQKQFPFVYEEQSIVLVDRNGARDTRKARFFSRVEDDGTVRLLVVFETPPAVRGVAMLAERDPAGNVTQQLYLPALGLRLLPGDATGDDSGFMGTDFTVEALTGELLAEYRYERGDDVEFENQPYFTVDVYAAGSDPAQARPLRRHFVRQDNFFVTRTDFFDARGEVVRRRRAYDLKNVDGTLWYANQLLMDDYREQHRTVIKVDRRVISRDYVPAELFSAAWLFEHYPQADTAEAAPAGDAAEPAS
jgi:hypothetical protein